MSIKFAHPFTCLVAGPTGCGKTVFVRNVLKSSVDMIDLPPERIIWCYGIYQNAYTEMMRELPSIEFVEGISDLESNLDPNVRNLVVIDDLMSECGKDPKISNLFCRGSHHKNLSIFFLVQNLFQKSSEIRTISLNSHYIVAFKNPRDKSQISHLGKQLYPGHTRFVQEAYEDATQFPYGYLLIDLKPNTPEEYRLRTNIFPNEYTAVYVRKT